MTDDEAVLTPLESDFLVPNATFLVLAITALVVLALSALLVVWPLVETIVRRQWGYTLGVVLLGPIGGLVWFLVGRRESAGRTLACCDCSAPGHAAGS